MGRIGAILAIVAVLVSCGQCTSGPAEEREELATRSWRCPPLPQSFDESDLIGTWVSRHGSWATDMIILEDDGTYQQFYYSKPNDYGFEISGNQWWLERRDSGGFYLHLQGMRYCLATDELCRRQDGGGGDWTYYDRCEGRSIAMDDEVILAITGAEGIRLPGIESAPREIVLWYLKSDADTTDSFFLLQE